MLAAERRTQSVARSLRLRWCVAASLYRDGPGLASLLTHCLRTPTPAPLLTPRSPECDGLIRRDLAAALAPPLYPYMYRMRRHTIYIYRRPRHPLRAPGSERTDQPCLPSGSTVRPGSNGHLQPSPAHTRRRPFSDVPFPRTVNQGAPSPFSLQRAPLCKTGFEHLPAATIPCHPPPASSTRTPRLDLPAPAVRLLFAL